MGRRRRKNDLSELKLTPEGWVFLVVLGFITVGAVLRNVNLLIIMAGMMYAALLLNWRASIRWLKSFTASRRLPKRLHAGEIASVQWSCENRFFGMASWNVVITDRITRLSDANQTMQPLLDESETSTESWLGRWFGEIFKRFRKRKLKKNQSEIKIRFLRVNAGSSEVQAFRTFFSQRGKYQIGPAELSTSFPFGLIVSRIHFPKSETLFVGPEIGQLHPTWERRVQSIASGSDTVKRQRSLEEDEFYALRPWRSGDSKKNIHWRTSAKYGQPIVKQHDQQNNRDFALMLDLHSIGSTDAESIQRCELALSFTATAILQIGNAVQGQVAVGVCGEESEFCHSRTQHGIISEVMKRLAVSKPTNAPQLFENLLQVANAVSNGTPIYIVSSRPRPGSFDAAQQQSDAVGMEADPLAKRVRRLLPLVRWIEVDSVEFKSMFTLSNDSSDLDRLKQHSERLEEC